MAVRNTNQNVNQQKYGEGFDRAFGDIKKIEPLMDKMRNMPEIIVPIKNVPKPEDFIELDKI